MPSRSGPRLLVVASLVLGALPAFGQSYEPERSAYAPPRQLMADEEARPLASPSPTTPLIPTSEPNYPRTGYQDSKYRLAAAEEPAAASPPPATPLQIEPPSTDTTSPAAVTPPAGGDAVPMPLARRDKSRSTSKPSTITAGGTLSSVGASLGVVLGVFLVIVWLSRRYLPQSAAALPKEAVEVLGWAPLGGRQQMHLMRIGNKLILVAVTTGAAETLTEVTDALEVERLTALCRRGKSGSSSAAFRETLREFEMEPAPGGFVGTTPASSTAATSSRASRTPGRLAMLAALVVTLAFGSAAQAQTTSSSVAASPDTLTTTDNNTNTIATPPALPSDPLTSMIAGGPETWTSPQRLSSTLQILLLLTVLSLAPAILLMTTSFVRIIVVLGLLKQALGTQQLPPSQVITALALFMTLLVMTPTWREVYYEGIEPYSQGKIVRPEEAWKRSITPIKRFLSRQIELAGNSDDVWLFYDYLPEAREGTQAPQTYDDVPLQALLPAFMLSELKTSFLIGFQIYLPFLILDIVVSSVTISMGMMMLPPVMISLPLKLLLFVLVDGWNLVVGMLMQSFGPPI